LFLLLSYQRKTFFNMIISANVFESEYSNILY